MLVVEFLSDEWIAALDAAARRRQVGDDDPLADVSFVLEADFGERTWRLVIDSGDVSARWTSDGDDPADVRLVAGPEVAEAIASGSRAALDAFMKGDLRIGGDVAALMANRPALETLGELFAEVDAGTD